MTREEITNRVVENLFVDINIAANDPAYTIVMKNSWWKDRRADSTSLHLTREGANILTIAEFPYWDIILDISDLRIYEPDAALALSKMDCPFYLSYQHDWNSEDSRRKPLMKKPKTDDHFIRLFGEHEAILLNLCHRDLMSLIIQLGLTR